MAQPKVHQGGVVTIREVDRKTGRLVVKRLRRIYTDAMNDDGSTPDNEEFQRAIEDAHDQTADQDIDGFDVAPLSQKP